MTPKKLMVVAVLVALVGVGLGLAASMFGSDEPEVQVVAPVTPAESHDIDSASSEPVFMPGYEGDTSLDHPSVEVDEDAPAQQDDPQPQDDQDEGDDEADEPQDDPQPEPEPEPEPEDDLELQAFTDSDGDGVADEKDNCKKTPNAGQQDSDEDGIGNACDPFNNKMDVENP